MSATGGWEEPSFVVRILGAREGLEAVGRKDLPRTAPVPGRGADGDSVRESAASASHPAAVRFPPALPEGPHRLLPVARPSGWRPSGRCDHRPLCARRAHSGFLPGGVLVPAADGHCVGGEAASRNGVPSPEGSASPKSDSQLGGHRFLPSAVPSPDDPGASGRAARCGPWPADFAPRSIPSPIR